MQLLSLFAILSLMNFTIGANIFYGLDYGVNTGDCPSLDMVTRDFRILSQYTNTVRIYSLKDCNLGELAIKASQANKMRLYLGMWIDKTDSYDKELSALQSIVKSESFHNVDAIIVGSEVVYRGDLPAQQLAERIEHVKELVHPLNTKVTTSEVYYKFSPEVVDAVDFLMMNAFVYWEGKMVDDGGDLLLQHYEYVKSISNGKEVRISETGWPDMGTTNEAAIPSLENQYKFMLAALCKTKQHGIDMLWFSAIDENYKPGVEAHFGLLNSNRQLKDTFQYAKMADPC